MDEKSNATTVNSPNEGDDKCATKDNLKLIADLAYNTSRKQMYTNKKKKKKKKKKAEIFELCKAKQKKSTLFFIFMKHKLIQNFALENMVKLWITGDFVEINKCKILAQYMVHKNEK